MEKEFHSSVRQTLLVPEATLSADVHTASARTSKTQTLAATPLSEHRKLPHTPAATPLSEHRKLPHTPAATPLSEHRKLPHTPAAMGSAALVAAKS